MKRFLSDEDMQRKLIHLDLHGVRYILSSRLHHNGKKYSRYYYKEVEITPFARELCFLEFMFWE
jgi:hypothetical protein